MEAKSRSLLPEIALSILLFPMFFGVAFAGCPTEGTVTDDPLHDSTKSCLQELTAGRAISQGDTDDRTPSKDGDWKNGVWICPIAGRCGPMGTPGLGSWVQQKAPGAENK